MKGRVTKLSTLRGVLLTFSLLSFPAEPAQYVNNFSSDIGAASLFGDAVLDNGSVRLTDSINNQLGSLVIDDLTPGGAVPSFTASFDIQTGP